ncbi:MAG: DUF5007 domain-containing protein [Niabella sp.]
MKEIKIFSFLLVAAISLTGCVKEFIPQDLDSFNLESSYTQNIFSPILGRNALYTNLFLDKNSSSRPLTFKLANVRTFDDLPAPELSTPFPVYVWKEQYTGLETTLEEIEKKRNLEEHSFVEIRTHSGDMLFWGSNDVLARSVKAIPDSGYKFDIEVSNSGGSKVIKGFRLKPYMIREYEPNNADIITGYAPNDWLQPASIRNVIGDSTQTAVNDIRISVHKVSSQGSSLKILFIDPQNKFINPSKFNLTDWEKIVHGFDVEKTSTYVKYNIAYPIPLVEKTTKYTTLDGKYAHLDFSYSRITAGGFRLVSNILFDFAIYTKGDWEIIVSFPKEAPKFDND